MFSLFTKESRNAYDQNVELQYEGFDKSLQKCLQHKIKTLCQLSPETFKQDSKQREHIKSNIEEQYNSQS